MPTAAALSPRKRGATSRPLIRCFLFTQQGFNRLFAYISGANAGNVKVPMTAPVTVDVAPGPGPSCGSNFTVAFFVPPPPAAPPPAPSSAAVFLQSVPARDVYVASYGGFTDEKSVVRHAAELVNALAKAGVAVPAQGGFTTASYDSPFRLLDRHNEIWVAAPAQPDNST